MCWCGSQGPRISACLWLSRSKGPEIFRVVNSLVLGFISAAAAAAKSLQSCPTLCNPRDSSPPGSPVPGILQARTLEWVAISFSNAWKWKVKVKSESRSVVSDSLWPRELQPIRLLRPWDFPGKSTGVGCLCPGTFNHSGTDWFNVVFLGIHLVGGEDRLLCKPL